MKQLVDYVQVIPDVLTNEECTTILKTLKASNSWIPAGVTTNAGGADHSVRACDTLFISQLTESEPPLASVDSLLFTAASVARQEYALRCAVNYLFTIDTGYEALRYKKGGFYKTHTDAFNLRPRVLSCSFALNDNYEGGEWGFFGEEVTLKAPVGSAVIFPSNFCFPHQILPVTKGTRYSVVTWFQ